MTLPASPRQRLRPPAALLLGLAAARRKIGFFPAAPIFLLSVLGALLGPIQPSVQALTFHLTFDNSATSAPAGFLPAFNSALQFYETTFTDPITINLQVGWGTINNQALNPPVRWGKASPLGRAFSPMAR